MPHTLWEIITYVIYISDKHIAFIQVDERENRVLTQMTEEHNQNRFTVIMMYDYIIL